MNPIFKTNSGLSIIETATIVALMIIITLSGTFSASAIKGSIRKRQISVDLLQIHTAQNKWLESNPGEPFPYGVEISKTPLSEEGYDLKPFFSIDKHISSQKFSPLGSENYETPTRINPWSTPGFYDGEFYSYWSRPAYANLNGEIIYVPGINTEHIN